MGGEPAHPVEPVAARAVGERLGEGGAGLRRALGRGRERGVGRAVHAPAHGFEEGHGGPGLVRAVGGPGRHSAHLHALVEDPVQVPRLPAVDGLRDVRRLGAHPLDGGLARLARGGVALPAGGVEMARAELDAGPVHQVRGHLRLGRRAQAHGVLVGGVERPVHGGQVRHRGRHVVEAEHDHRGGPHAAEERERHQRLGVGVALQDLGTAQEAGPPHAGASGPSASRARRRPPPR